jgi:hypothetical protein
MKYVTLLLLLPLTAWAGDAVITCTPVTKLTDGRTAPATGPESIIGYRYEYGTCTGTAPNYTFGTQAGQATSTGQATCGTTFTGLSAGLWCFRGYTKQQDGTESAPTNAANKIIPTTPALPPAGLTVAVTVAYYIIQQPGKLVALSTGSVPPQTAWDTSNMVIAQGTAYCAVPNDVVTWFGKAKPSIAVMVPCG